MTVLKSFKIFVSYTLQCEIERLHLWCPWEGILLLIDVSITWPEGIFRVKSQLAFDLTLTSDPENAFRSSGRNDKERFDSLHQGKQLKILLTVSCPATPKSASFAWPSAFNSIFPAFISLQDDRNTVTLPITWTVTRAKKIGVLGRFAPPSEP